MRIDAKDLRGKRTVDLWDVVPLAGPWTLFLDVTNICNFKCVFCPTGHPEMLKGTPRGKGHMSFEIFEKVVHDLKHIPKLKMVNLYKDGEPLARPGFTRMVQILKDANVSEKIWVKTNGVLIDRHPELATCGLDMVGISVPHVHEEGIKRTVGARVDYEKYRDTIKRFYESERTCEISVKIADTGLTQEEKDKFYHDFEDISDYISIEGLHGWSASDVENMQVYDSGTFDGNPFKYKIACPLPFYMMTVNYDGTVSVCNDDWAYWHRLGDVKEQSVSEIWNGEKFKAFRLMHLDRRRRDNPACNSCQYLSALPDSIDDHLEEMKGKMYA